MFGRIKKLQDQLKEADWQLWKEFLDCTIGEEFEHFGGKELEIQGLREEWEYQPPDEEEYELGYRKRPYSKSLKWFGRHAPDILVSLIADVYWLRDAINVFSCVITNHYHGEHYRDDSYGTPDTGYMGITCMHCGWSAGERLY